MLTFGGLALVTIRDRELVGQSNTELILSRTRKLMEHEEWRSKVKIPRTGRDFQETGKKLNCFIWVRGVTVFIVETDKN